MCTYNITIDDSLMAQVKPTLGSDSDIAEWVQQQVELVMKNHLRQVKSDTAKRQMAMQRFAKLATAESISLRDLEGILPETEMSPKDYRDEYIFEKYGI